MDSERMVTELWQMYRNGQDYVAGLGLPETARTNVAFYQGEQWAPPTKETKHLPRPVVNMVKFVCRNKRAKLTLTPVKLEYRCDDSPALAAQFTRFADYMMREMHMTELDSRAIKDGLLKGSYCYHFYWEDGGMGAHNGGALRCELLDPLHVYFANPCEPDEQRQEWILIATRVPVKRVLDMCDSGVDVDLIAGDSDSSDVREQAGSPLCTLLTRYFRVDNQVFCERATRSVVINRPFPLCPIDYSLQSGGVEEHARLSANLYPVVFGSYEEREGSIYGISEAEGIVPNQRIINHTLGLEALSIQNTAWGKYVVAKDALRGQQISNQPGEVLVDYSAAGNGIRKLEHAALSGIPGSFVDNLTNLTRITSGSSEIMTGEQMGNMSGTAIAQLQSQANKPIEEARERFWRAKERQGLVLMQCCKLYYDCVLYRAEGQEEAAYFRSDDYLGLSFSVTVRACTGTGATVAADINLLETLFARGAIDARTFVQAYPDEALCNKENILRLLSGANPSDWQ